MVGPELVYETGVSRDGFESCIKNVMEIKTEWEQSGGKG